MALADFVRGRPAAHGRSPESRRVVPEGVSHDEVVAFLEEARRSARLQAGKRFAVTYLAQDRIGLVADVTERIAQMGMNVEGASEATVGPFAALTFVVSTEAALPADEVTSGLEGLGTEEDRRVFTVALDPTARTIPTRNHTLWVLNVRTTDQMGVLHRVADRIAESEGVLVRFSSAVEKRDGGMECKLHINFAIPHGTDIRTVLAGIDSDLDLESHDRQLVPTTAPVEYLADIAHVHPNVQDAAFVCVVGDAQVGLVSAVAERFASEGLNVVGSAMAILESRTVAVFALDAAAAPGRLEALLDQPAKKFGLRLAVLSAPPSATVLQRHNPYRFRLLSVEQRGVLAAAARVFANHDCNIESVFARVVEAGGSTCTVRMVATVGDADVEALRADMERASIESSWASYELVPHTAEFEGLGAETY